MIIKCIFQGFIAAATTILLVYLSGAFICFKLWPDTAEIQQTAGFFLRLTFIVAFASFSAVFIANSSGGNHD